MWVKGFVIFAEIFVWLVLHAAQHSYTAWLLVTWPALLMLLGLLSTQPRGRALFGAWCTWLMTMIAVEALGLGVAIQKGWARTDDGSAILVSIFLSSLVGVIPAAKLWYTVFDALDESRVTRPVPPTIA